MSEDLKDRELTRKIIGEAIDVHFSRVRSYMKATGTETGLLLNFASMPLTIKRVGREQIPDEVPEDDKASESPS